MLIKIADYFKVSTDFLLGRTMSKSLDCSGLSEKQVAHLRHIVNDLSELKKLKDKN